jgi:ATP-dependent protease HslVU (ClpYQ) peptidase subunit
MTCIVGVETGTSVIIGGDSSSTDGFITVSQATPKVFVNNGYLIGFTTSWRMGQLLQYVLQPVSPPDDTDLTGFMVTEFIPAVRECLTENGWTLQENNRDQGGKFLVGVRNQLFMVDDDFHVSRSTDGIGACGSGEYVSLGALWATRDLMGPKERVRLALETAARYTNGVVGPFILKST